MRRTDKEAAQRFVESVTNCNAVVILWGCEEIAIYDNSGVTGLTGEPLLTKTLAMLEELFPKVPPTA